MTWYCRPEAVVLTPGFDLLSARNFSPSALFLRRGFLLLRLLLRRDLLHERLAHLLGFLVGHELALARERIADRLHHDFDVDLALDRLEVARHVHADHVADLFLLGRELVDRGRGKRGARDADGHGRGEGVAQNAVHS